LLKKWNTLLDSEEFINASKRKETDFTRQRAYSFKSLFLFITSTIQSSLQRELDRFFSAWNTWEVTERFVTQSSFSQARQKIKPEAFQRVNQESIDDFYAHNSYKKWHGFRLIGIDGSEVFLPKTKETIEAFGEYTTNFMHDTVVLARASKAYDVLNEISIDAKLVNREIGEHTLANQHFEHIGEGDLALLDRGYPSHDLFRNILERRGHFCARVAVSNWSAAKELVASGEKEMIKEIKPGYEIRKKHKEQGIVAEPIKCRFVCVELSTGEKEVLITSLLDAEKYPYELFKGLYHLRWGIEEAYKKDKHRLQLENFSGKTVIAILQDFYANILMGNLTSMLSAQLEDVIDEKTRKPNKHKYQINTTTALAKVKEILPKLFSRENIRRLLEKLLEMFVTNLGPIRPNRSFKRRIKKRKRYFRCYLPL
jgi:hypothetical protein